jgi:hypothetical protein
LPARKVDQLVDTKVTRRQRAPTPFGREIYAAAIIPTIESSH